MKPETTELSSTVSFRHNKRVCTYAVLNIVIAHSLNGRRKIFLQLLLSNKTAVKKTRSICGRKMQLQT